MKRIFIGIVAGVIAGLIDVTPMIIQGLTWDANLSAFTMWVVIGFFISVTEIKIHPMFKGLLISFIAIAPTAIIIGWKEPVSLLPISVMTLILGSLLGVILNRILNKNHKTDL